MSTPIIASPSNGGLRRGLAARMAMFAGGKKKGGGHTPSGSGDVYTWVYAKHEDGTVEKIGYLDPLSNIILKYDEESTFTYFDGINTNDDGYLCLHLTNEKFSLPEDICYEDYGGLKDVLPLIPSIINGNSVELQSPDCMILFSISDRGTVEDLYCNGYWYYEDWSDEYLIYEFRNEPAAGYRTSVYIDLNDGSVEKIGYFETACDMSITVDGDFADFPSDGNIIHVTNPKYRVSEDFMPDMWNVHVNKEDKGFVVDSDSSLCSFTVILDHSAPYVSIQWYTYEDEFYECKCEFRKEPI